MANTIQESDLGNGTQQQAGQQMGQGQGMGSGQAQGAGQQNVANQASGSQAEPVQSNPNQQKGSGYTNIQKLVNANQNNGLGQAVGQGIQNAGQQVQGNLNQAQSDFQQQTGQNQFNTQGNQQLVQNVLQDPTKYVANGSNAGNPQGASTFQNLISGVYKGPTGLANSNQLQSQAQDVANLNQATNSPGGQMGLLQRFVGGPQYNQGQQKMDSLLLGQTGQQQLGQARQATAGLGSNVNSAITGAQAQGQQQTNLANQFGQQVQNQFGQTVTGINQGLQQQAQKAQLDRDTQYQKMLGDYRSGKLTSQEAQLLGVTPGQQVTGNTLQNINQFLTENPDKANAQNLATSQNYAQINALRQLAGQNAPQDAQNILGQFAGQDSLAGKFNSEQGIQGDQTGFQTANQNQINSYNQQLQPSLNNLNNMKNINDLVNQRDAANNIAVQGNYTGLAAQQAAKRVTDIQNQLNAINGASTNGNTRADWAKTELAKDQDAYNQALNSANSAYGSLQNLTINPNGTTG